MFSITWNRQDPVLYFRLSFKTSGLAAGDRQDPWRNGRYLAGWGEAHPATCNIEHEQVRNRRRKGVVFGKWRGLRRMAVRNILRLAVTDGLAVHSADGSRRCSALHSFP